MKHLLTTFLLLVFVNAHAEGDHVEQIPGKAITINQLEDMFHNINENAPWDMSKDMLWGYFFTHHEPELLDKSKLLLEKKGYTFVKIFISDKEDPNDPDKFWLHVEKKEVHTPESLDKRNDELYIFAHEQGIDTYDGMDVGPVQ